MNRTPNSRRDVKTSHTYLPAGAARARYCILASMRIDDINAMRRHYRILRSLPLGERFQDRTAARECVIVHAANRAAIGFHFIA